MAVKGKAAKPAAPKEDKGGDDKPRKPRLDAEATIKILVEENPKREGSKTFERFKLYRNGMTVKQALEKGVTSADIRYDVEHEYIKLTA